MSEQSQDNKTLRDEFAMAALTGITANQKAIENSFTNEIAMRCYQFADAMLEARKKNKP